MWQDSNWTFKYRIELKKKKNSIIIYKYTLKYWYIKLWNLKSLYYIILPRHTVHTLHIRNKISNLLLNFLKSLPSTNQNDQINFRHK